MFKTIRKKISNVLTDEETKILYFLVFTALFGYMIKFTDLISDNKGMTDEVKQTVTADVEAKFDLRTVTKEELMMVRGIGEKKAEDILTYREQNGFKSLSDLMNIKGIGKATFEKIRGSFLEFGEIYIEKDLKKEEFNKEVENLEIVKIDINTATEQDFMKVKGIGLVKAKKIIELRRIKGKFTSIEELMEVKGIGKKTFEKIAVYLTVE
ncbi:MAG: helix-hairpin-helix domain-containing protein [Candidatus Cloacimonetes bacterium]|nr:helix-hairpin-helix domain-containing protein [Candidatus Cloacimonadota bacterium]